ncbi:DUF302 domain-containing protein [bacterium]|nr:DUF302 domain-containing protein [bacterium]
MKDKQFLTLYQREGCPYCQLVRKKLTTLNLPALMVPVEEQGKDRKELRKISGQQAVPVLIDGETIVNDSIKILEYLDKVYGMGKTEPLVSNDYGLRIKIKGSFSEIIEKTTAALKIEGFGVLTEIDVKKTLKNKIGVDVPEQIILGACNPNFAHQAMEMEPDLGLLLPCNVTVRYAGQDEYWVTAINPVKLLGLVGRDDLLPFAVEVKKKLENMLNSLS